MITDSAYVTNVVKRIERSVLKDVSYNTLYHWLSCLYTILQHQTYQYIVSHIKAHSLLPGFIAEGNTRTDKLTIVVSNTLPYIFKQTKLSYIFFHQNAQALVQIFHISKSQTKTLISTYPNC